jgi:hypothetical protein
MRLSLTNAEASTPIHRTPLAYLYADLRPMHSYSTQARYTWGKPRCFMTLYFLQYELLTE